MLRRASASLKASSTNSPSVRPLAPAARFASFSSSSSIRIVVLMHQSIPLCIKMRGASPIAGGGVRRGKRLPDESGAIPSAFSFGPVRYDLAHNADFVGRENVIGGTDCGLSRVAHETIQWAKFRAMADGARLATKQLWGR